MVLNVLLLLNDQAATSTLSVRWGSLEQRSWAVGNARRAAGNHYRAPGIATGQRATGVARGQRALPGGQLPVARGQDFGSRCLSSLLSWGDGAGQLVQISVGGGQLIQARC